MATALLASSRLSRVGSVLFFVGAFAAIATLYLLRAPADWAKVYLPAAQRLGAGEELFTAGYLYPPVFAWLILPLTKLSHLAERLVWALVNAISLSLLLAAAWRVSGANRVLDWRARALVGLIGAAVAGPFLLDTLTNQQNDLVVIALVLGGCALMRQQGHLRAACCLGLAAAIKCTPLLWAPYLLWRRRFVAALVVVAVAIGVNLLPDWTHPPDSSTPRLLWWAQHCVVPNVRDRDTGVWASAIQFNHSVAGVCNRCLVADYERREGKVVAVKRDDRVSAATLKVVVRGISLALLGAALVASWRARGHRSHSANEVDPHEFGLVVCLMLLLSPMSSKPHFGILILPVLLLACQAVTRRHGMAILCLLLAVGAAALSNKDLAGAPLYAWATWHGSVLVVSLALFVGCAAALQSKPDAQARDAEPLLARRAQDAKPLLARRARMATTHLPTGGG